MSPPLPPTTLQLEIRNDLVDFTVVVSLKETEPDRFVVTLGDEPRADRELVIEEWRLRKGRRCLLEFDADETFTVADTLRLSLRMGATHADGMLCATLTIAGFQH